MKGQIKTGCTNNIAFTGLGACALFESTPKAVILTVHDFKVPAGTTNVGEYLRQQALVPMNGKVFPIMDGLVNLEPSGGDVRTSQEGFGESSVNGHNPYQEVLTFTKGGLCMLKELLNLHGQLMRVFFVDDNNVGYGTTDESGDIYGYAVTLGVHRRKNVGTTPAAIIVTLLYSNNNYTEVRNMVSFEVPVNMKGIRRMHGKIFTYGGGGAPNYTPTIYVKYYTACSGVDISKEFLTYMNKITNGDTADTAELLQLLKGYTSNTDTDALLTAIEAFAYAHDFSYLMIGVDDGVWLQSTNPAAKQPRIALHVPSYMPEPNLLNGLAHFGFGVDGELY